MIAYAGYSLFLMYIWYVSWCSSFPVAYDGDVLDSEIVVSVNGDDLKQLEEKSKRRIELEAEERKLEETLEYQRQIEKEAKQKHLVEQNKKSTQMHPEKVAEGPHDVKLEPCANEDVHEPFKLSVQVIIVRLCLFVCVFFSLVHKYLVHKLGTEDIWRGIPCCLI